MSADIDILVSSEMRQRSRLSGEEWVLQQSDALDLIELATAHRIAVLGLELFEIEGEELQVVGYSGYDFKHESSWEEFVAKNNQAASQHLRKGPKDPRFGYILTTASEREFSQLRTNA